MTPARALLLALALPFGASALGSGESGVLNPSATGGATGLITRAVNRVREKHERACLSGIRAYVNIYVDPNHGQPKEDPNCHAGSYNDISYFFYSPEKPNRVIAQVYQPIGAGPICMAPRYGDFDLQYPGDVTKHPTENVRPTCITDFDVDTGRALAVAGQNGLALGTLNAYALTLMYAETSAEPDWGDKRLRRKVFWVVSGDDRVKGRVREYLVDAKSGAFIKARWGVGIRGD